MPSWGIHLATANEILKKVNIEDSNAFLLGNFIPDAERHVVKDFSIFVPYDVTHFPEYSFIEGHYERLPNFNKFLEKYKGKISNPLVLGYLTHLITDYYWNRVTHLRYTITDKNGVCVGIKLNNGTQIEADKSIRKKLKHNDFYFFERYLIKKRNNIYPEYNKKILEYISDIEEIKYIESDFEKIIDYLNSKQENIDEDEKDEYKLFTFEQLMEDYENSIEFIIDFFETNKLN